MLQRTNATIDLLATTKTENGIESVGPLRCRPMDRLELLLTRIPSQRDTARRGRSARSVRIERNAGMSAAPIQMAAKFINDNCDFRPGKFREFTGVNIEGRSRLAGELDRLGLWAPFAARQGLQHSELAESRKEASSFSERSTTFALLEDNRWVLKLAQLKWINNLYLNTFFFA